MRDLRSVMDAIAATAGDGPVHMGLYDELAPLYDFERARMRDYDAIADFVDIHVPSEPAAIAVGACGSGHLLARLAERYERVVGLDLSSQLLELAAEKTDAELVLADLRRSVARGAFDAVTILGGSIANIPPRGGPDDGQSGVRAVLTAVREALRPGGVLLLDFMERGTLETGSVDETTFASERFRVERTVVTTGEPIGETDFGPTCRYTFAYAIEDLEMDETVRVGTSMPVRSFDLPALIGAALNAGFEDVSVVGPPTHGTGLRARRGE